MVGKVFTTRNMLRFPKQFATPVNSARASKGNNSAEMKYQIVGILVENINKNID